MALTLKEKIAVQNKLEKNTYIVDQLIENENLIPDKIASTKRTSSGIGKNAPPATGSAADELASTEFKEGALGKVKGLIQVQKEQQANDALKIQGIQGELFPEEDEETNQKTGKEQALEDWRREQGLEGTNVTPPWWNRMQINPVDALKLIPILTGGFGNQLVQAAPNSDMLIAHQTHTDNPLWSGEHNPTDHILYDPSGEPYMIETEDGIVPYTPQNVETYL